VDLVVIDASINAAHAAAGDLPIELKVTGIEDNLTHHTFIFSDAFEAMLLGGFSNKRSLPSYKISR
jgi:hypothetical protein